MVLKRLFTAIGVLAAALALSLSATTTASAAATADVPPSEVASASVPDTASEQRTCRARFSDGVNQRLRADAGSTILGIIPAGTWVQASCTRVAGGTYTACGLSSDYWMEVFWNGKWGYSVWSCVQDWEYTN
ncbi:hypothetical protein [Glycomyces sp. NRRL B-16210]|uniref:hypothetical protein n=1 Tax=Glycomyces sp. NRRL B-16210 TaxID=1463821 RepID=UPI000AF2E065|nr:hypothetical protein [Glycomyces sp. NRRL B-16210]